MIRQLRVLTGVSVFFVVIHHAIYRVIPGMSAAFLIANDSEVSISTRINTPSLQAIQLLDQVAIIGVPVFLFVSGFFGALAVPRKKTVSWTHVWGRINRLLIPYLIWSGAFIAIFILIGNKYSFSDLVQDIFLRGVLVPYYYIPMLIFFLLLSPWLLLLAQSRWKLLIIASFILLIIFPLLTYVSVFVQDDSIVNKVLELSRIWRAPRLFFWFILGMVMALHQKKGNAFIVKYRKILLILVPVTFIFYYLEVSVLAVLVERPWTSPEFSFLYPVFSLLTLLAILSFFEFRIPFAATIGVAGSMSFGIYLMHYQIQLWISDNVSTPEGLLSHPLVSLLILIVLSLAIPIALILVLDRSPAARYRRYVIG